MTLVVPGEPTGRSIRLVRRDRRSPLGEIACVNSQGNTAAWFDARQVLAYLGAE